MRPAAEKGFAKRFLLFNYHREVREVAPDQPVIIAEGPFDLLRVKETGFAAVALLGSSMSKEQEELITIAFNRVILMLDGDSSGRAGTEDCLKRLSRRVFVKTVELADDQEPDMMSRDEIVGLLLEATRTWLAAPTLTTQRVGEWYIPFSNQLIPADRRAG